MVTFTPRQKNELSQFLEVYISEKSFAIYWKFGMWGTDGGGHLHSKDRLVSSKQECIIIFMGGKVCNCNRFHKITATSQFYNLAQNKA